MAEKREISRRQFVASAVSVAAVTSLPVRRAFAGGDADKKAISHSAVTLTDTPGWKDQGIENLAKSPHAKLRDIPVRAVTIRVVSGGSAAKSTRPRAFQLCTICSKPTAE